MLQQETTVGILKSICKVCVELQFFLLNSKDFDDVVHSNKVRDSLGELRNKCSLALQELPDPPKEGGTDDQ